MRLFWVVWLGGAALIAAAPAQQMGSTQALRAKQEQLLALTNQARAQAGVAPVKWDPALAAAAMKHCMRMAAEGPIGHQYPGEPDLSERAGLAGAHFSLIEENVAVGAYPAQIHQGWLNSPGHRRNMLNPDVDTVGIAVVALGEVLYAVVDFEKAVPDRNSAQVEAAVAALIRANGITVRNNPVDARAACALDHGVPRSLSGPEPGFIMRWQDADMGQLPPALVSRLHTREFTQASVGSCPAQNGQGSFTVYRVAVMLYGSSAGHDPRGAY
jgi:hypothetical protein